MHKAFTQELPLNNQKYYVVKTSLYASRFENNFKLSILKSSIKDHCISVIGVKLWNSQPENLKLLRQLHIYKNHIKKALLANYAHPNT